MTTRTCKHCGWELPIEKFSRKIKNGREYRQSVCNACRALSGQVLADRRRNRAVNALLKWKPTRVMT